MAKRKRKRKKKPSKLAKAKKKLKTAKGRYNKADNHFKNVRKKYNSARRKARRRKRDYDTLIREKKLQLAQHLKNHGLKSANSQCDKWKIRYKDAKKRLKIDKKKLRPKVRTVIADKIASAKRSKTYHGRTAIYPTKSKTGSIVIVANTGSEGEDNSNNITSYAIDHAEPTNDYSHRETKQVTVEGVILGKKMANARKEYDKLNKWNYRGTELTLRSHITYYHLILVSLNRNYTADMEHGMNVTMTFQFAYRGQLNPGHKKSKAKKGSRQKKGNRSSKHKSIKIKSGDNYWTIAQKYHTTVANLTKLNGSPKKTMYSNWWRHHKLKVR